MEAKGRNGKREFNGEMATISQTGFRARTDCGA